jgi:4-alpha-glucanotransferase
VSVGAPPDAFSATGQDWGMPLYEWDAIALEDFRWLRERARRSSDLFHGYRVDHLVGFYRTYGKMKNGGAGFFTPPTEPAQLALGERLLGIFRGAGAEIIAEDLGTVPDFVRASLARLGIPGYRVFRWERHWHTDGEPFRDPPDYPHVSVATSGTHDTEPIAIWWDGAPEDERRKVGELPIFARLAGTGNDLAHAPFSPKVRDLLLEALFASGSDLLLLPMQDAFGWRDRINEPATVTDENWTYRLPWPVDQLDGIPEACERRDTLRAWSEKYGRG